MEYVYIAAIVGFTLYYIASTIAENWRKAAVARAQVVLKQEMLQRGMATDDIVKVIQASHVDASPKDDEDANAFAIPGAARTHLHGGAPDLVGLAEQGITGDGLARIQEAWGKAAAQIRANAPAEALDAAPNLVGLAEQGLNADDLIKVLQAWASTAVLAQPLPPPGPKASTEFKASL